MHLLGRAEANSNLWAAESCFAREDGGCFACSQGCDSALKFFTECCQRRDRSPYVKGRKK